MIFMSNISYLIKFDDKGYRAETYAQYVHYNSEKDKFVKDKLAEGCIFVSAKDYNNLCGNNDDNKIYIKNDKGKFVPEPEYVPTAEEEQQTNLAVLDNQYATQRKSLADELIVAQVVNQDEEYANDLRQQIQALDNKYVEERGQL